MIMMTNGYVFVGIFKNPRGSRNFHESTQGLQELLHLVIGSKFSRHFFNQSEVNPKPIVASACPFSRALCRLRVTTSSFDWLTGLFPSFLIGQSNYFGFGFTTLD